MWFQNTKFFGLRGTHEHRQLCFGDIQMKIHDEGEEYIEFNERQSKTRQGASSDIRQFPPKAFATRDDPKRCPVTLWKKFCDKRPGEMCQPDSPFYLSIHYGAKSNIWYKKCPIGVNNLASFMSKMAARAGLTGHKSNHSVRATTCTRLMQENVPPTIAAQLTGHKNLNSLNNYTTASVAQQKQMSNIIK